MLKNEKNWKPVSKSRNQYLNNKQLQNLIHNSNEMIFRLFLLRVRQHLRKVW